MTTVENIAVINDCNYPEADAELLVEAIRQVIPLFCRDWQLPEPGIAYYGKSAIGKPVESAALFIVDSTGDETAFAKHSALGVDFWSYVDVAVCQKFGEPVSRAASHEIWELIADPGLDRWIGLPDGSEVAVEVCDPLNRRGYSVGAEFFGRRADVELSTWVLPAWYEPGSPGPYDHLGMLLAPLEDATNGYHQVRSGNVIALSGSNARVTSFGRTARRMRPAPF